MDILVEAEKNVETGVFSVSAVNEDIDLLIVQRPLKQGIHDTIVQAQRQGIPVVVELDDDFETVHPKNMAWREVQPHLSPLSNYEWLRKSMEIADWVTVSTPALTKYAPHGRVSVLRNCVPESIFDIRPYYGSERSVGWTGTVSTHPGDLDVTGGAMAKLAYRHKVPFNVIGDGFGVTEALGLNNPYDLNVIPWAPIDEYYQTIANNISVGIVPLEASAFNEAKSNLKGLEMAALGIPFVASPTSEYKRMFKQGIGLIADSPSEWFKKVESLVSDSKRRTTLGNKYSRTVREHYVYERNAKEWYEAWQAAIAHRKGN